MKIGIIGWGVVGSATGEGFITLGHEVSRHDPKFDTQIYDVLDTDIVFVCVPTPEADDGSCDLSIIHETIDNLKDLNYEGVIALKSTIIPGTTESIVNKYNDDNICFVPEFLRERSAYEDFLMNNDVLAIGAHTDTAFALVCEAHGSISDNAMWMTPTEAEILKYYSNTFNALRVTFANVMYEVCEKLDADYGKVLEAYLERGTATSDYMECGPNMRGYGGMCLPKDTKAMADLIKKLNLPFDLFDTIDKDNDKVQKTVFDGMRE